MHTIRDCAYVSDWIEGVAEILQSGLRATSHERRETKSLGIVGIVAHRSIAIDDLGELAGCVVINVCDNIYLLCAICYVLRYGLNASLIVVRIRRDVGVGVRQAHETAEKIVTTLEGCYEGKCACGFNSQLIGEQ